MFQLVKICSRFLIGQNFKTEQKLIEIEQFLKKNCSEDKFYYPGKNGSDYVNYKDWFRSYGFVPVIKFGMLPSDVTLYVISEPVFGAKTYLGTDISRHLPTSVKLKLENAEPVRGGYNIQLSVELICSFKQTTQRFFYNIFVQTKELIHYDKNDDRVIRQFQCR